MKYGVYSIRDHLGAFGTVFCHANENTAKRYVARLVDNSYLDIGFSPADYDLFHVADFDDATGLVDVVTPIEYICNGIDLIGGNKREQA